MTPTEILTDPFNRRIDYIRVSVTDRCNFRCVYCMPEEGAPICASEALLSFEEMGRVLASARKLGFQKVRLTGGEPLTRKGLVPFVAEVAALGFEDISLTTNGYGLAELAQPLKQAGLHRVNISLDTRRPERFAEIARRGNLERVLEGITAAQAVGLTPVKINQVAMRGVNDDEAAEFARWTLREPVHIRFIELMPIAWNIDEAPALPSSSVFPAGSLVSMKLPTIGLLDGVRLARMRIDSADLQAQIEAELGKLEPAEVQTNGPARTFRLADGLGTVGFISQISNDLCSRCNRIRLTADGFLRPCLMADGEVDVGSALRRGISEVELDDLIRQTVSAKPERHYLAEGQQTVSRGMSAIGG
jgi:cyclic pyranopterin phosphate synthase